jgi:hypothetical protein
VSSLFRRVSTSGPIYPLFGFRCQQEFDEPPERAFIINKLLPGNRAAGVFAVIQSVFNKLTPGSRALTCSTLFRGDVSGLKPLPQAAPNPTFGNGPLRVRYLHRPGTLVTSDGRVTVQMQKTVQE